ncbi:polysaccharide biosynthesis/export family protein [Azotobacter beijerinckii]|uniref:polysaccharide biosynthesis/export family protein n=1 Tax=Azotobacter beijerinckii TaxID=170623 RepID=UPI0029540CBC|nr:polysaccharide biosynthesis/export family protein [Azotobacter beijerinckii]MDV7212859.1 polysaccharide biosynthesis/export family protein [Azotobacter beijerinckii]
MEGFALSVLHTGSLPVHRTLAVILAFTIGLQGCMFSPGQHLDTSDLAHQGPPDSPRFELVPITPRLVATQNAARVVETLPPELTSYAPGPYVIGVGDVLNITVWDHPELTSPAGVQQAPDANGRLVRPDGRLFYPYIGETEAAGLTIEELRNSIAERLARYIESPQVDVAVTRFGGRRVILTGAFGHTGPMPLTTLPMTLPAAVGQAGVGGGADIARLILKRDGREYRLDLDALNRGGAELDRIYLKDGDQLHLPTNDSRRIFVLGEVVSPGPLSFRSRSMNLTEVIGSVRGLRQETSNPQAVYVIRGVRDLERETAQVFQLDAKSPASMVLAAHFQVEPQDVVYVGAAGITRWNRFISQLFPSASFLNMGIGVEDDINTITK